MPYVSSNEACKHYKVSSQTLRRWAKERKVKIKTTEGGHRRYYVSPKNPYSGKYIYARVTLTTQKKDLKDQIKLLQNKYPKYELITDVCSGISFKRTGLKMILDNLFEGLVSEIVVTSPDRLARLGFDHFQDLFYKFGATITVLDHKTNKTPMELNSDLHTASNAIISGSTGYKKHKVLSEEIKEIEDDESDLSTEDSFFG